MFIGSGVVVIENGVIVIENVVVVDILGVLGFVGVALGTVVIVDILGVIVGIGCRFVVDIGSTCCCYWEHLLLLLVILGVVGIGKVVVGDIGSRLREKLRCR